MIPIKSLFKDEKKWAVGGNRRPQPFPGRFPTRFAIDGIVYIRGKYIFTNTGVVRKIKYMGKPSPNMANMVLKMMTAAHRAKFAVNIWITEFDKGGAIATSHLGTSSLRDEVGNWNGTLFKYYHPWDANTDALVTRYVAKYRTVKLKYNGKGHRVYTSIPAPISDSKHKIPHKIWLDTVAAELGI